MAAANSSDGRAVKRLLVRGGVVAAAVVVAGLLTRGPFPGGRQAKEAVGQHLCKRKQRV
jgi:hypothetical protein